MADVVTALVWWVWLLLVAPAVPVAVVLAWIGVCAMGHILAAMHGDDLP